MQPIHNRRPMVALRVARDDPNPAGSTRRRWFRALALSVVLMIPLGACTVGPDFQRPAPDLPDGWYGTSPESEAAPIVAAEDLARWWSAFGDATLSGLMERAAGTNLDLRLAQARVRQARAAGAVAAGGLGPTLDGTAAYQRSRSAAATADGGTRGVTGDLYQAGFDAGWEIDIFGGRRRSLEAADADLMAAVESLRDIQVSLMAEVASNYIQLRAGQRQLAITQKNLAAQQHSARLTRQRFEAGLVSGLDVVTSEAQAATTASQIPLLESSIRQSIYTLGILVGEPPAALLAQLSPEGAIPLAPPTAPAGLPSDLLRRRPDIRLAEARIHAATARIGVATADLFPRFTLTGSAGYRAGDSASLFDWSSRFWSLGPSVNWRLFESGRLRAAVAVQQALTEQESIAYQQTVLTALREVENALVASEKEQRHRDALQTATAANRKAVVLAEQLYTEGLTDFINVLQAQQARFNTESALVQSQAAVATQLVALYKALGGGWEDIPAEGDGSLPPDQAGGGSGQNATMPVQMNPLVVQQE